MLDHLSIEVLGVLRGSADGPLAVAFLGAITLIAVILVMGRIGSRGAAALTTVFGKRGRREPKGPRAGSVKDERASGGTIKTDSHRRSY